MLGSRAPVFESAKWGELNLKNKEAIDDTTNCSRCSVGIQLCDGIQRGHPAGAGRSQLRLDDQGCGRLRPWILARSGWPLPSDGHQPDVPSRLSHRARRQPLLAELIFD